MKIIALSSLLALSLSGTASAFIGYGTSMFKPNCAFACRTLFANAPLECTQTTGGSSGESSPTSPECYASNTPWLTTLGYCINATCADIPKYKLEAYWAERVTKDEQGNRLQPKWTYQETLFKMANMTRPTKELGKKKVLNFTALYNPLSWESTRAKLNTKEYNNTMHSRWGIVLLVVSFGLPIFVTCLGYLPFMSSLMDKIKPRLVWPSIIGTYHARALPAFLGNAPTLGQTWYIVFFLGMNVLATAASYRSIPYPKGGDVPDRWKETMGYISTRNGVISFALAPLVILFAGRNNILLWLTNWSYSTYMVLHRWVARIFTLHVLLHAIMEYMQYKRRGTYGTESKEEYWIWGIVAAVSCCIMMIVSTLYFRRASYEIFLIMHIVLAVIVIVGAWYHVQNKFHGKWGYHHWLYASFAVWAFDRVIRIGRIAKNGMRRSEVTQISDDIVRIDIKDIRWEADPGRHTFAYFPTLNPLRPWENHPFSIIPTALLRSRGSNVAVSASSSSEDVEKSGALDKSVVSTVSRPSKQNGGTAGISLYVRKSNGLTKALKSHKNLLTLLDGPYPNNSPSGALKTDRLILIAGGIGIPAVLPFITHHLNVKLYWSVKAGNQALVDDLGDILQGLQEKDVRVGERFDIGDLLDKEEADGWKRIGVVVCGPGELCDDVRSLVAKKARSSSATWELDVEAFSW